MRQSKSFYRTHTGSFYVQLDGRQINLARMTPKPTDVGTGSWPARISPSSRP